MKHDLHRLERSENGWATIRMRFNPEEADLIERAADAARVPVVKYLYTAIKTLAEEDANGSRT
jgi:uncharacterized protein (DUF1778 family)